MVKITLGIDGMNCGMCEMHVNNAIKEGFDVKRVESSHEKKVTVLVSKNDISENELRDAIAKAGFAVTSFQKEPYEKKGIFGRGKK